MRRIKILKVLFIFWLFLFFLIVLAFKTLKMFFLAGLDFNIPMMVMLSVGSLLIFQAAIKLTMLSGTFGIMAYKKGDELEYYLRGIEKIMPATIAHMFHNRAKKGVLYFTQDEAKEVIAWLHGKFSHTKSYVTFFSNTALMTGLLGTFAGLLISIDKMGAIVMSLAGDINIGEVITGFAGPIAGMATGFSSSILGVVTAMVLGMKQYFLDRSEEAFIEDIEDWLKGKIIESQSSEVMQQFSSAMAAVAPLAASGQAPIFNGGVVHHQSHSVGQETQVVHANYSQDTASAPTAGIQQQNIVQNNQPQQTYQQPTQAQAKATGGFIDVFVDTIGNFTQTMEKYNKSNEVVYKMLSQSVEDGAKSAKDQGMLFENISSSLKELNINQFSSSMKMEESLQDISNVMIGEHRTIKQLLSVQEQLNENILKLVKALENDNKQNKKA